MGEPLVTHEMVSFEGGLEIILMDTDRDAHEHVLWALSWFAVHLEQVRAFKRLEAEEIIVEVAFVVENCLDALVVLLNDLKNILGEERCWAA